MIVYNLNIELEVTWVLRSTREMEIADRISKEVDWSDYRLSVQDMRSILFQIGGNSTDFFSADYLASDWSFQFFS